MDIECPAASEHGNSKSPALKSEEPSSSSKPSKSSSKPNSKPSSKPGNQLSEDPTIPRWVNEMTRGPQKKINKPKAGGPKVKGLGSFYLRAPGNYSLAEFLAKQPHQDRVRTADLNPGDRAERDLADDDSHKESDWLDRTSIDPNKFKAQKEAEEEVADRREFYKRAKRHH